MLCVQIGVTVLSVAAVVLSAVGVLRLRRGSVAAQHRTDDERDLRAQFLATLRVRQADAPKGQDGDAERHAAHADWVRAHQDAGLEPITRDSATTGREILAERIITDLAQSTKVDTVLVGVGLACGLAASIWGTWAL